MSIVTITPRKKLPVGDIRVGSAFQVSRDILIRIPPDTHVIKEDLAQDKGMVIGIRLSGTNRGEIALLPEGLLVYPSYIEEGEESR